jgi:hypothetical protein
MFAEASPPEFQSFASPDKATPARDNASDVPNRRLTLRSRLVQRLPPVLRVALRVPAMLRRTPDNWTTKLTKSLEETEAEMRFEWKYFCSHLICRLRAELCSK